MWVGFADEQGLGATAQEFKAQLASTMTPAQIESAEIMSIECKKKGYKDC